MKPHLTNSEAYDAPPGALPGALTGLDAPAAGRKPIVAIVGRQNVGKSTLLNRLAGRRIAIVEDMPGTTRDRVVADIASHGGQFTLVDTGGLEISPESTVGRGVRDQVGAAVAEADVILYMGDVRDGVTTADVEAAEVVRRSGKPVLVAVNKADNDRLELHAVDFHQLGLGEPIPISAHHGRGTADLLDRIGDILPALSPAGPEPEGMKVAIVGRPNVGKSMLLNAILGRERSIVDDTPGTTRDAVDTLLDFRGESVLLIDTAGMRRRGRLEAGIERYSVMRALRAIDRADVALVVMDATELPTAQDMHVTGFVQQAARGIVLVVNKWDLVADKDAGAWDRYIRGQFRFVPYAPVLYTSARFGEGVDRVLPCAADVYRERLKRIPTSQVSSMVHQAVAAHSLPRKGRRQLKVLYATQAEVNPPTFVFFVNDASLVHFSYRRYLENKLRQAFGFAGTPLRMVFKSRGE
jgi:GTP-binding protein